jgi:hypothetical protein
MKTHPLLAESANGESGSLGVFFDRFRMAPLGPPKWMKTHPLLAESANGESGSLGVFFDRVGPRA